MKKIIVPLDGSELAEQALPLAGAIASREDAEIILVTAIEAGDRWVDDGFVRQWESEELAAVESYLRKVIEGLEENGLSARLHADWGRPDAVIRSTAAREDTGLIIMTTHGRSGVSRWVLGSIADKVLRTTNTPVILVHSATDGHVPQSVSKIAVALDGSELAESAIHEAELFAQGMAVPLLFVRSVEPPAALYGAELVPGSLPVLEQLQEDAGDYLEDVAGPVRKRGLDVETAVAVGPPAEAILETVRDNQADLVVMTSHGRSGLERWAFGSVADAVVRRGDVPVMIVRPSEAAAEEPEVIPVAGNVVVPPPAMTETPVPGTPEPEKPGARPHRPERRPAR